MDAASVRDRLHDKRPIPRLTREARVRHPIDFGGASGWADGLASHRLVEANAGKRHKWDQSAVEYMVSIADNLGEVSDKPLHVTARGPQQPCVT